MLACFLFPPTHFLRSHDVGDPLVAPSCSAGAALLAAHLDEMQPRSSVRGASPDVLPVGVCIPECCVSLRHGQQAEKLPRVG